MGGDRTFVFSAAATKRCSDQVSTIIICQGKSLNKNIVCCEACATKCTKHAQSHVGSNPGKAIFIGFSGNDTGDVGSMADTVVKRIGVWNGEIIAGEVVSNKVIPIRHLATRTITTTKSWMSVVNPAIDNGNADALTRVAISADLVYPSHGMGGEGIPFRSFLQPGFNRRHANACGMHFMGKRVSAHRIDLFDRVQRSDLPQGAFLIMHTT